jgi:type III secretion protein T
VNDLALDFANLKGALFAIVLATPRVAGMIWTLPVFAMTDMPGLVRQVIAIALALPMLPVTLKLANEVELTPFVWMLAIFKELAIGAFIGFGLGVSVWVFSNLGELVDTQAGYTNLYVFNNILSASTGPFATIATQAGVAIFIAAGGLGFAMQILLGSYAVWPIESFVPTGRLLIEMFAIKHMETLFNLTVKLSVPAILVLLILEVSLGLVARFGKAIDTSSISYAAKSLAGLVVMALLLQISSEIVGNVAQASRALAGLLFQTPAGTLGSGR